MNTEIFFESASDERGTPQDLFDQLNAEFHFDGDAAASKENAKCETYFGFGGLADDALEQDWCGLTWFLNPPYSVAGAFVKKAREEADKGAVVVQVLPVRSDTKYWHKYIWDKDAWSPSQLEAMKQNGWFPANTKDHNLRPDGWWRPGVTCRFIPGRLTFTLAISDKMRQLIMDERRNICQDVSEARVVETLVEATGLPKMAIKGIWANKPDDELLEGAPFPSCIVIFRKAE